MLGRSFKLIFLSILLYFTSITVNGRNRVVVTQENVINAFSTPNTVYIINSRIDFQQATLVIPQGSTLRFGRKAYLFNGSLTGNKTKLRRLRKSSIGIILNGTWQISEIKDSFFDWTVLTDNQILDNVSILQSENVDNVVYLSKPQYNIILTANHKYGLVLKSNTRLSISSHIKIQGNNLPHYAIVYISEANNIIIKGGQLEGDVGGHTYREGNSSQWGFGLAIITSSNITVSGVHISKCIGDGIYIGGGKGVIGEFTNACKSIIIQDVVSEDNRRQGISITYADNVIVKNSIFKDTGKTEFVRPGCGMDIEPNIGQSVRNVIVDNCKFLNNDKVLNVSIGGYQVEGNRCNVEQIRFVNCEVTGYLSIRTGSVEINGCDLVALSIHLAIMPKEKVRIIDTRIKGGAGVRIRSVGDIVEGNNASRYLFDGCDISASKASGYALFGTINHKGNEQAAEFVFNHCRIEIPNEEKFQLIQKGCVCDFSFEGCTIITHGQNVDVVRDLSNNRVIVAE